MTERAFVIVTTHAPRPEQSPLQSRRVPPDVISVTCVPAGKLAPHTPAEQRSPGIRLVTVPGPPVTFTVSVYVLTGGGGGGAGGSGASTGASVGVAVAGAPGAAGGTGAAPGGGLACANAVVADASRINEVRRGVRMQSIG